MSEDAWNSVTVRLLEVPEVSIFNSYFLVLEQVLRKKAPKAAAMKTESAINQARRAGLAVETTQKCKIHI